MERNQINQNDKWKLEDIYASEKEWEKAFEQLKDNANLCQKYKGRLYTTDSIYNCLKDSEKLSKQVERLYAYAKLRQDEDTRNSKYKTLSDRIENLYVTIMSTNSFIIPALSKLPVKFLKELKNNSKFSDYDYFFKKLIDDKKYVLSEKEERLLSKGGELFGSFSDIFTMIDNADLELPEITYKNEKIKLSHAKYSLYMQSEDRILRKKVFSNYYKAYINKIHTIAQVYSSSVKKDWYFANIRGYKSSLEKSLKNEDVSVKVYDKLIYNVNKNLKHLHSYMKLRKKALNYSKLHMYDLYVPIVKNADIKLSYQQACETVLEGLKPLGEEYNNLLQKAMKDRWIDVYENEGKKSGAYSMGVHGVHPYVLLNYEKTTHDVFTIAHELGHSLHSYYSEQNQPYAKADYTIFVAEVASTVNEVLLLKHITANTKDKNLKKYLLSYYLDMFRTTLFRQTLFSEFEAEVHKMVEENIPLTYENMSKIYLDLTSRYYGKAVICDEEIKYEWARIPHFYRNFYVYKYATGITCAVSIAKMILEGKDEQRQQYIKFLSSGGSDAPTELLKIAGVDLTKSKPYKDAMTEFENTLTELKKLI